MTIGLSKSVKAIVNAVKDTIEETPPELIADIMDKGVYLAGGGAQTTGQLRRQGEHQARVLAGDFLEFAVADFGYLGSPQKTEIKAR